MEVAKIRDSFPTMQAAGPETKLWASAWSQSATAQAPWHEGSDGGMRAESPQMDAAPKGRGKAMQSSLLPEGPPYVQGSKKEFQCLVSIPPPPLNLCSAFLRERSRF